MSRLSALFMGRSPTDPPLLEDLSAREPRAGGFRPFVRRESRERNDNVTALTDLLISMRETIERQGLKHDEVMTYLAHIPKAMEMMPELSKQQAETLAVMKQHLENQGPQGRQIAAALEKVGQTSVDMRRILDSVRQRLDMLAEHDQLVATHFNNFASALSSSSETTKLAGELLQTIDTHIRARDESFERMMRTTQRRHTVMLAAAMVLATAALIAATVGVYVVQGAR